MNATTLQRTSPIWWLLAFAAVFAYCTHAPKHFSIKEVSTVEARELINAGAVVIDVRDRPELTLPGAFVLPQAALEAGIAKLNVAKTAKIVVYCGNGSDHGPTATETLNKAGYVNAVNLKSGFQGWTAAGLPTVKG
jgi:rhodanese-related sulfurtransferase